MLTLLRRTPLKYQTSQILTSMQDGYVYSDEYMTLVHVGCSFKVPEHWSKLTIVERFGPDLVLEHNFLSLEDTDKYDPVLYPVSVKIYEGEDGRTLLFREGISGFLKDIGALPPNSQSRFVTTEIKTGLAIELAKESDYGTEDLMNYLVTTNESTGAAFNINRGYVLPCMKDDEYISKTPFVDNSLSSHHTGIVADLRTSVVNLSEIALQRNHVRNHIYDWSPISYIDETYDDEPGYECLRINYGALARSCMYAKNIRLSQALSCCGARDVSEQEYTRTTKLGDFVPLTHFVSSIMNLILWVQHSPFLEMAIKYILPKRGTPEGFSISNAVLRTSVKPDFSRIPADLHRLTQTWTPDVSSFELVKVDTDELFLTINKNNGVTYKYYIDITIATVLTQELIHRK